MSLTDDLIETNYKIYFKVFVLLNIKVKNLSTKIIESMCIFNFKKIRNNQNYI